MWISFKANDPTPIPRAPTSCSQKPEANDFLTLIKVPGKKCLGGRGARISGKNAFDVAGSGDYRGSDRQTPALSCGPKVVELRSRPIEAPCVSDRDCTCIMCVCTCASARECEGALNPEINAVMQWRCPHPSTSTRSLYVCRVSAIPCAAIVF